MMLRSTPRACAFLRAFSAGGSLAPSVSNDYDKIPERLRVLCTRGRVEEALSLFYTLETPHSHQIYATLFHACATHNRLQLGQSLHHHMVAQNPHHGSDLYVNNHLINMYAKCGELEYAHQLFDEMPLRNVVTWTALISGFSQHGRGTECFALFSNMLADYRPNEFAYASVLTSCQLEAGRQVHSHSLKTSFHCYVFVANALITMYSRGCVYGSYRGDKDEATLVFRDMEFRNLVSWNSMIAGFHARGLGSQVVSYFSSMQHEGIGFDRVTLLSVFSTLSGNTGLHADAGLRFCYALHCLVIKDGFLMDIGVMTAVLKAYSNLGGEVADCHSIFLETNGSRDIVLWTSIIATFTESDPPKALSHFHQFLLEGMAPDSHALSIVLKACAGLVTQRSALIVHSHVLKGGFKDDIVVANALVHAYSRCGSIGLAKQVFDELESRDTVSWNSMLKAYALHGQAKEAMQLFRQMNVQPDGTTFVALLSACSHAGMVEEGTKIFNSMSETYGVVPQLDHFACMVDVLGRAGRILEAYEIIRGMPMEPDYVVWSAFLGACRKHGETNLASLAANKLKELNSKNSLGYVLMSNIYNSAGIYAQAGCVRSEMKVMRVLKEPGLSWIELGDKVHEFASGGRQHPQGEAIRASLEQLVGKLKGLGYVPETSLALHDVEEEQKQEQLYYHSEKLALAFALMNAGSCSGGVIQIMKNIRICVDCHNFMKVASELVRREIVVRDSNRFHHFKEGACSCNDYCQEKLLPVEWG